MCAKRTRATTARSDDGGNVLDSDRTLATWPSRSTGSALMIPGCRARTTAAGQLSRSRSGRPSPSRGAQLEAPLVPWYVLYARAHSPSTQLRLRPVDGRSRPGPGRRRRPCTFATGRRCHGQAALHHARDDGSPVHRRGRERCD
jgi:hypothetical protein